MAREAYGELTKGYAKLQEIAQKERVGEQRGYVAEGETADQSSNGAYDDSDRAVSWRKPVWLALAFRALVP